MSKTGIKVLAATDGVSPSIRSDTLKHPTGRQLPVGRDLAAWSVFYARQGVAVFPCAPRHKRPLTDNGFLDASTNPDQVCEWWECWPDANIGAPTGLLFDVLDFDVKIGLDRTVYKNAQPLIERLRSLGLLEGCIGIAETRHTGSHLFFPPSGRPKSSLPTLHLDFQAVGAYVVLPPSRVPPDPGMQGQGRYRWVGRLDLDGASRPVDWPAIERTLQPALSRIATAPRRSTKFLANRSGVRQTGTYVGAAIRKETRAVAQAAEGRRNHRLNTAAFNLGRFVPQQADEETVFATLLEAAERCGLPATEAIATITSGLDAGMRSACRSSSRDRRG